MLKTRGVEADGTPFKPGDLSGSEEEIGESVVNGLKQFFTNVNSEESYYGYIGDTNLYCPFSLIKQITPFAISSFVCLKPCSR